MTTTSWVRVPVRVLEALAVALVASIMLVISGTVVLRIFGVVTAGSTELATLLFVWTIYIGAVLAFLEGGHLAITALANRFHGRAETAFLVISDILLLVFLVAITLEGLNYVQLALDSVRVTPSLKISPAWQYSALLVGMLLSSVFIAIRVCVNIRQFIRGLPALTLHTRHDDELETV